MFELLVVGARVSLLVGFVSSVASSLIGGTVGILAGFFGGKLDIVLMRITDYFLVLPDVPLMIVIAALFGRSLTNIIVIIGLIYWTSTARRPARAGEERARARLRAAGARARRGEHAPDHAPRAAAGDAAADREHRALHRLRDLRSRRSSPSSVSAIRAPSPGAA